MNEKDIIEKLNEIALEANWGSCDRVDGAPKAVLVIQEAIEEIKRLREDNLDLQAIVKADKLCVGAKHCQNQDDIRQLTAKEILQDLKDRSVWFVVGTAQFVQDHFWEQFEGMCQTYNVELDENV
ncbi:MAG: hypothetical protein NC131_01275 [Roseburia sp.]|nr:hypothetical protein [Roseburia sp.]